MPSIGSLEKKSTARTKYAGDFFENALRTLKMLHYVISENDIKALIWIRYASSVRNQPFIKVWIPSHPRVKIYAAYFLCNTLEIHGLNYTCSCPHI